MAKVLVVDDEESICWGLSRLCETMGHSATACSSAEEAFATAESRPHDLVFLDVRLPGIDGLTAMSRFQAIQPRVPIVVMTAYGELDSAVAAIKNGAFEYLPKPFDMQRAQNVLQRALHSVHERNAKPDEQASNEPDRKLGDIVGSCPAMQEVFRRIAFAATSNASVLINGESGTGKELVARAIHRNSVRSEKPFVAVNIAALSPTLAESELFGHVKGSFTGADSDRTGLLVQANEGTLFLDELAEIPLSIQVKLLRCLDQGEVLPIGSNRPIKTDFRVISATHQDLPAAVEAGRFRHDLFFRICSFQIDLPPLREREDDLFLLAEFFIRQIHQQTPNHQSPAPTLSPGARRELQERQWSGNVRELRNAIEHAMIMSRGSTIEREHLPMPVQTRLPDHSPRNDLNLQQQIGQLLKTWTEKELRKPQADKKNDADLYARFLRLVEPEFLTTVMNQFDQQYLAASRALGIHRTTLKKKLTDLGIDKQRSDPPPGESDSPAESDQE